jgi:predicted RecB family endonuclease
MGIGIKIAIAAILFSVVSGGYFYIQALQGKLEAAAEVQQRMESVIDQQKLVMEQTQRDLKLMNEINQGVAEKAQAAQNEVNNLSRRLSRLDSLTKAPPSETEMRVNRGTRDALRCNEIVTGSSLTADELSGKIKNNVCNDLIQSLLPNKEPAK